MASLNLVQDGVEKASRVSPRQGKWATPKEIDLKTSPKQTPLQATLAQLVKDARIEKKAGQLLYRPQQGAGLGGHGKPSRAKFEKPHGKRPERPDGKKPDRPERDNGKKPDRPERPEKPDRDDRAERERKSKIEQDRRRREAAAKHKKMWKPPKKSGRRDAGKTIVRGVATRAVSAGMAQGIAPRAISTVLM